MPTLIAAAALNHEPGDHPVKNETIVMPRGGIVQKVFRANGRFFGIELDANVTLARRHMDHWIFCRFRHGYLLHVSIQLISPWHEN
jgi:hypothetical protein